MKNIIVRSVAKPHRYIGGRGWTARKNRALGFRSTHDAIHFCLEHDLPGAEILVQFPEPTAADVVICVPAELMTVGSTGEEWVEAAV